MCQTVHDPADESWQEGGRGRACERAAAVCCRRRVEVARRQQSRARAFLSLPEEQGAPSLVQLLEGGARGPSAVSGKGLTPFESARLGDRK